MAAIHVAGVRCDPRGAMRCITPQGPQRKTRVVRPQEDTLMSIFDVILTVHLR